MANVQEVRTRLATAHTALERAAALLQVMDSVAGSASAPSEFRYMERELHKLLGRLEALDAGLAYYTPEKRRRQKQPPAVSP